MELLIIYAVDLIKLIMYAHKVHRRQAGYKALLSVNHLYYPISVHVHVPHSTTPVKIRVNVITWHKNEKVK